MYMGFISPRVWGVVALLALLPAVNHGHDQAAENPHFKKPRVYVLKLDKSTDRTASMVRELRAANIDYTRLSALDGDTMSVPALLKQGLVVTRWASLTEYHWRHHNFRTTGKESLHQSPLSAKTAACALSHKEILKTAKQHHISEDVMILEDDVRVPVGSDFWRLYEENYRSLPENWDILFLGAWDHNCLRSPLTATLYTTMYSGDDVTTHCHSGTYAWVIRNASIQKILNKLTPFHEEIDHQLLRYFGRQINAYWIYPSLVEPDFNVDSVRETGHSSTPVYQEAVSEEACSHSDDYECNWESTISSTNQPEALDQGVLKSEELLRFIPGQTLPTGKQLVNEAVKSDAAPNSFVSAEQSALLNKNGSWLVPQLHFLDSGQLPGLKHIHIVLSGGDTRDFTRPIQMNHLAWAHSRQVGYQFYTLDKQAGSFSENGDMSWRRVLNALGNKQKYWAKVAILQDVLEHHEVPEGQWVVWLDDDVVVNDFRGESMLDRAVEEYGKGKSLLLARDGVHSITPFNTGLIMVKNDKVGRKLISQLWSISDHPRIGYEPQFESLHEQEGLKIIYNKETLKWPGSELDFSRQTLGRSIGTLPYRKNDFNINTWVCDDDVLWCSNFLEGVKADRKNDAFIHHPALGHRKHPEILATLQSMRLNYPLLDAFYQNIVNLYFINNPSGPGAPEKKLSDHPFEAALQLYRSIKPESELLKRVGRFWWQYPRGMRDSILDKYKQYLLPYIDVPNESRELPDQKEDVTTAGHAFVTGELLEELSLVPNIKADNSFYHTCRKIKFYTDISTLSAECQNENGHFRTTASFINPTGCDMIINHRGVLKCKKPGSSFMSLLKNFLQI